MDNSSDVRPTLVFNIEISKTPFVSSVKEYGSSYILEVVHFVKSLSSRYFTGVSV